MKPLFSLAAFAALIVLILTTGIDLPVVQVSHSTGQCVRVLPHGSCDKLPEKYQREWVQ